MLDPTIVFFCIILLEMRLISAQEREGDKDFHNLSTKKTLSYGICKKQRERKKVVKKQEREERC
jgi:hypothetical protein